ncbi:glycine cleavage system aminomethyltransferase GcvT, partial [bacterium]|nr:glycine cleavage system aminomethyltransferase GcvT [bacterium]
MDEGLRRTPLYDEHLALGGRMVPFAGWEMPVQYSGIIEEHLAVRSSAGLFDVSHMAEFRVFGFGAFDFLQSMFTNDLGKISLLGSAQYTLMCDEDGGIIDDLIVYHTGDLEYLIIANAGNAATDWDWLRAHAPEGVILGGAGDASRSADDGVVELVDESDRTALMALQGPAALSIIRELAGEGFEPPVRFSLMEAELDSVPVLLARTGYTGEDGVEILCHTSAAPRLWRAILSFPHVAPCGLGARDTLRLEMGYPLHGSDIDRGVDPISAGLGWVVPRDKTGYVGAAAIARIRDAGPARKLVGLAVEGAIPRHGYSVLHDGDEVGKVASGTFSPTLQTGIATAYLPVAFAEPGTEVSAVVRKKVAQGTVT